jgi:hypothetical protein
MATNKTYFFGWANIKKLVTEIVYIYSNKDSFFSKKRIESSIAFIIGQAGMVSYFYTHLLTMVMSDVLLWAGVEFAIAGWVVNAIQKEKLANIDKPSDNTTQINS